MSNVTPAERDQLRDPSRDPVVTDGDKYRVVLENERVRVLEYRDSPGQRTTPHHHPDYVLCALGAFKRKFVLSDGREAVREVPSRAGAGWYPGRRARNRRECDQHMNLTSTPPTAQTTTFDSGRCCMATVKFGARLRSAADLLSRLVGRGAPSLRKTRKVS